MISPEILRRYPIFSHFNLEQITTIAKVASKEKVEAGTYFFHEGDRLENFFLVLEGAIAIVFELPDPDVEHKISEQFSREYKTKDVVVSTVGPGEMFGWSGLVPPYEATASVKTLTPGQVLAFDCKEILKAIEEDWHLGYLISQKIIQVIKERLHAIRIESLAYK